MTDIPHILGGRYEVGDLIGRGGMAQVHIGYDTRLSRTIAIKILRSDLSSDPTFLARFRREAQSAAALNHPAIVAVYDTGEETIVSDSGRTLALPYIVMEYVKGRTVSTLLKHGQALPINEAVQIAVGVLSALEYSHYEGIIHRDIKPANIMISQDGKVKVMDFGIARAIADSSATMTSTKSVVGTAQYLSPEQARGEVVDARSDLYSTGCLIYELLTGKPPFQGDSAVAVAYQHVSEPPKVPSLIAPDIPDAIDRVVMKSLAKKREDRYQTASEMRTDLLAALRGDAIHAPAIGTWETYVSPSPLPPSAAATQLNPVIPATAATNSYPFTSQTATDITPAIEEEEETQSKKWLWVTLAVLGVIVAMAGLFFGLKAAGLLGTDPSLEITQVDVPDMKGMDEDAARKALTEAGLKIKVGDAVNDEKIPEGQFVSSDPAIGTSVDKGSIVTVHFSAGIANVKVPDVTGGTSTQEEARKQLEEAGLRVGNVETTDEPGIAQGMVVSTDPAPGTVIPKQTPVTLYVASGEVKIDSYIGLSLSEAEKSLNALKIQFDTEQVSSDEPAGTIVGQNPGAGKIAYNSRVKLSISSGKAPTPAPENPDKEKEKEKEMEKEGSGTTPPGETPSHN